MTTTGVIPSDDQNAFFITSDMISQCFLSEQNVQVSKNYANGMPIPQDFFKDLNGNNIYVQPFAMSGLCTVKWFNFGFTEVHNGIKNNNINQICNSFQGELFGASNDCRPPGQWL